MHFSDSEFNKLCARSKFHGSMWPWGFSCGSGPSLKLFHQSFALLMRLSTSPIPSTVGGRGKEWKWLNCFVAWPDAKAFCMQPVNSSSRLMTCLRAGSSLTPCQKLSAKDITPPPTTSFHSRLNSWDPHTHTHTRNVSMYLQSILFHKAKGPKCGF